MLTHILALLQRAKPKWKMYIFQGPEGTISVTARSPDEARATLLRLSEGLRAHALMGQPSEFPTTQQWPKVWLGQEDRT